MSPTTLLLPDLVEVRTASLNLWKGRGQLVSWSPGQFRQQVSSWATALRFHGIGPGSTVALAAPTSLELVAAVIGAWRCGAAVAVLPQPDAFGTAGALRLAEGIQTVRPTVLLIGEPVPGALPAMCRSLPLSIASAFVSAPSASSTLSPDALDPDAVALLQLTSGSTGRSKVVPITHAMLMENCRASCQRAEVGSQDHMVSWLPLTHDMGFSGALVHGLAADIELTLIPTEVFARSPLCLLEAIAGLRATLSPNPPTAYAVLARLGGRARRECLDLSSWRYAWVGAEPVFASVLEHFENAMRPLGLSPNAIKPAYGMAEAVVALTSSPAGQRWRALHVQGQTLRSRGLVVLCEPDEPGAISLVSNGPPLDGVELRVCDEGGVPMSEGRQGAIWVRGPSVARSYLHGEDTGSFVDGWYDTGDIGFVWQGELYVSGRAKDIVARGGLKVGARDIEVVAEGELRLHSGRVAAFASMDHAVGRERLILVVARHYGADEAAVRRRIAEAVAAQCGLRVDEVCFVGNGTLPLTTSGKLRRAEVRERWERGEYTIQSEGMEHDVQTV